MFIKLTLLKNERSLHSDPEEKAAFFRASSIESFMLSSKGGTAILFDDGEARVKESPEEVLALLKAC